MWRILSLFVSTYTVRGYRVLGKVDYDFHLSFEKQIGLASLRYTIG